MFSTSNSQNPNVFPIQQDDISLASGDPVQQDDIVLVSGDPVTAHTQGNVDRHRRADNDTGD